MERMARPRTVARVHAAVLALAEDRGVDALTMEGIAAAAGVGKQTLYRSWDAPSSIVLDALLAEGAADGGALADTGDLAADLCGVLREADAAIRTPPRATLLRALAARMPVDASLARAYRERLQGPQRVLVAERLRAGGIGADPPGEAEALTELLLAPLVERWFVQAAPMGEEERSAHVARVLRAATG